MDPDPEVYFVSIGPLLQRAAEQLDVGQMVQCSTFSLFEAMSAVEIGNPKMDAGARPQVERVPLEERPLLLEPTLPQLLSWMDRLLTLEATWHVGGAMAQTVYSSLHMMQIPRLAAHPAMSGYARALQALCRDVNNLVLQACVCEEEDFVCHSAGLPVEEDPEPADKLLVALGAALDAHGSRMAGGAKSGDADARLSAAIHCRLAFRKLLWQAVGRICQRTKQDLDAAHKLLSRATGELAVARASAALGAIQRDGDDTAWAELGFDLGLNSHLAPPTPPRVVKALSRDEAFTYFEGLVDQLMHACRVTAVADYPSLEVFTQAYSASHPCAVGRAALHLQLAQQQTLEQAASTSGAPPTPPLLTPAQQPWAPSAPMLRAATLCLQAGPPLGEDAELFLEQALIATGNWVQAVLLNPARHRRRLRRGLEDWAHLYQHAINADCSEALGEAAAGAGWAWRAGAEYPAPLGPLSCWVERQTARVIAAHLLMGFELELYEPRDYAAVYWYVENLLATADFDTRALLASRPKPAAVEAAAKAADAVAAPKARRPQGKAPKGLAGPKGLAPKGLGGASGGGGAAGASASGSDAATAPAAPASLAAARAAFAADQLAVAQYSAMRPLLQGLVRMMAGLEVAGVLAPPPLLFNSTRERFVQLFGSFHILTRPEPLTYELFDADAGPGAMPAAAALQAAAALLGKAAAAFKALTVVAPHDRTAASVAAADELARECATLERVAQQNRLACMVAERAAASGAALELAFEFLHRHFPVAVLRSKKA